MTPRRETLFSSVLPATPLYLSRTLDTPRALLPELHQKYKDTIRLSRQARRSQDTVNNN